MATRVPKSTQMHAPRSATLHTSADSQNPSSRSRAVAGESFRKFTIFNFSPHRAWERLSGGRWEWTEVGVFIFLIENKSQLLVAPSIRLSRESWEILWGNFYHG